MSATAYDKILTPAFQDFLRSNSNLDVHTILLSKKETLGVPASLVAQQILGRKKAKEKLPTWFNSRHIIYPPILNLEQSSSEATGLFKTNLFRTIFKRPPIVADLTGGFGVDTWFFSLFAQEVAHIEPDVLLSEIAAKNLAGLGATNIHYHPTTSESFLKTHRGHIDIFYADPSRRKETKKVFRFQDCSPNVIELQNLFPEASGKWLVKASPMLDIHQGCLDLKNVQGVFVISVHDECKELLFLQEPGYAGPVIIQAIDLDDTGKIKSAYSFTRKEEEESVAQFSDPLRFLYEPGVAILKAGAFKSIAEKNGVKKLSKNSHLYTSLQLVSDFPGRVFKVNAEGKPDAKIQDLFEGGHANIISRNHPLGVTEIMKKTGLKEGGELYLICTQGEKKKFTLVCERVK